MNMDHKHVTSDYVRKRIAMWKLEGGDSFTMQLPPGNMEVKHREYVAYKRYLTQRGYLDESGQVKNPFKLSIVWCIDFSTEYIWSDLQCWPRYWEKMYHTEPSMVLDLLPNISQLASKMQKYYLPQIKVTELFESTNASDENYALKA